MKTEDLINKLSLNLPPVKRIFPVSITFTGWIFFVLVSVIVFIWSRSDNFQFIHIPQFFYELIPIILIFFSSAFIAMYSSIPGNRIKRKIIHLPILFLLFWIILLSLRYFLFDSYQASFLYQYHGCINDFLLMCLPSASVLLFIINRRIPVLKNWIGFWVFAASAAASAFGEAFLCPNEAPSHILLVHLFPVICMGLFGIILGNLLFREV